MTEATLLLGALIFLAGFLTSHARLIWLMGKYDD